MDIKIVETKPREIRPKYFDVRKGDIMGRHPHWPTPARDPFPEAGMDDFVRKVKIGEVEWMFADITGEDADKINRQTPFTLGGKTFYVESETMTFGENGKTSIEAFAYVAPLLEPIKEVESLRRLLAESHK